jgi:hypothetical protein
MALNACLGAAGDENTDWLASGTNHAHVHRVADDFANIKATAYPLRQSERDIESWNYREHSCIGLGLLKSCTSAGLVGCHT